MINLLKESANRTFTENGAETYETTNSYCLDLFATIGAMRHQGDEEVIDRFVRAYAESPDRAMKILFYARDIREGLGERKVFRTILRWLANNQPESLIKNIRFVAEFGRYDDLLSLIDTPCEGEAMRYIQMQLDEDLTRLSNGKRVSLLAKWMPSINTSSKETRRMAQRVMKSLGLTAAEYRRTLAKLRKELHIIENNLRLGDYTFDYEKQTSRSLYKYKRAFMRNDERRYSDFIYKVYAGQVKLNADNVMPYELVEAYLREVYNPIRNVNNYSSDDIVNELNVLNATWKAMPDFGSDEDAIAVIDTSGSMYFKGGPAPASVALSLGIYFAEHNKGAFKNHFIEFSRRPQVIEIKGESFTDKLRYLMTFNEVADTNLEAVFDLIFETAVRNNLSQEDLPGKLVIISDMEFNMCIADGEATNFQNAKEKFHSAGYKLPEVIFWNVASRNRQQPVTKNEAGVALVSGATPRLFSMIAGGELSPYKFMMEVLGSERYAAIAA